MLLIKPENNMENSIEVKQDIIKYISSIKLVSKEKKKV